MKSKARDRRRFCGATLHGSAFALLCGLTLLSVSPSLPAQTVIISEILASNQSGLRDCDGDTSDWVELENVDDAPVDLSAWFLTDDPRHAALAQLSEAGVLEPGARLVVFASGKSAPCADEVHVTLRLDADGEYLALVRPDGTVSVAFAPAFPKQRADISYGVSTDVRRLIASDAEALVHLPQDGSLGDTWRAPDFVADASWRQGPLPVGYSTGEVPIMPEGLVSYWPLDGSLDDLASSNHGVFHGRAGAAFVTGFDGRPGAAVAFDGIDDYIEVTGRDQLPIAAHDRFSISMWVRGQRQDDRRVFSEGSSANNSPVFNLGTDQGGNAAGVDVFIRDGSGGVRVSHQRSAGDAFDGAWHHIVWVDDQGTAALYIDGVRDAVDFSYTKPTWSLNRTSIGAILRASSSFHFAGSIDEVSLWSRLLDDGEIEELAAGGSPLELGGGSLEERIRTDLAALHGVGSSAWIRVPFDGSKLTDGDRLWLDATYDDGFVAWLNGVEVARRNAPDPISWDSAASVDRDREALTVVESIRLGVDLSMLALDGSDWLAVQLLNASVDDEEVFLEVSLRAESSGAGGRWFAEPSPGFANPEGSLGLVTDTRFSVDRGFFFAPFDVEVLTETPGAVVRYTLDGTLPTLTNGADLNGSLRVETTTTLRAAAFLEGWIPSNVDTQTWIFPDDVHTQTPPPGAPGVWESFTADWAMDPDVVGDPRYADRLVDSLLSIPSLSVVLPFDSLFGPTGIYSNARQSGIAWERATSLEMLSTDGDRSFQIDAGVRIIGNRSRASSPKHGLRFVFRGRYGATDLEFPLFEDSAVDKFDTIVAKPNAFDSWVDDSSARRPDAQYIRDRFVRDSQRDAGWPTSHGFFAHVYLNGLYWGVFDVGERPDASFAAAHFGGDEEDWDSIKNHEELVDGSLDAYRQLDSLRATDLGAPANFAAYREWIDLPNFIDYLLVNFYAPADDWPGNYYMVRERRPGAGFRFVSWDAEYALRGGVALNRTLPHRRDADSPTKFHHAALANEEYRVLFGDRIQRLLFAGGALTPDAAERRYLESSQEIEAALVAEAARWGDNRRASPYLPDTDWRAELESLRAQYFPLRTGILFNQLRAQDLWPDVAVPVFSMEPGEVAAGSTVELTAPAGTVWYTLDGSDPRLEGGGVSGRALRASEVITVGRTTRVLARARVVQDWSALVEAVFIVDEGLRITELQYHPLTPAVGSRRDRSEFEFVELENTAELPIDLNGLFFSRGIEFDFERDGAVDVLRPGEVVVLVADIEAFASRYDLASILVAGEYRGKLRDSGERIELRGREGELLHSFVFEDDWHPTTDGEGPSLVVVDARAPRSDWEVAEGWQPSHEPLGTPGFVEDGVLPARVRPGDINEDGRLDISDVVRLLSELFGGGSGVFPCGDGSLDDAANVVLLDANGDARIDLSDAVTTLLFLFQGGPAPVSGTECIEVSACPQSCG